MGKGTGIWWDGGGGKGQAGWAEGKRSVNIIHCSH